MRTMNFEKKIITSINTDLLKELKTSHGKVNFSELSAYLYLQYASALGHQRAEYYKTGTDVLSFIYNQKGTEITFQPQQEIGYMFSRVVVRADFDLRSIDLAKKLERFLTKEYFKKYEDTIPNFIPRDKNWIS